MAAKKKSRPKLKKGKKLSKTKPLSKAAVDYFKTY